MVAELKTEQPRLYRKMIVERNRNWLPRIDGYLKSPETEFILVGPDGLIEALRKRECRVKKLSSRFPESRPHSPRPIVPNNDLP